MLNSAGAYVVNTPSWLQAHSLAVCLWPWWSNCRISIYGCPAICPHKCPRKINKGKLFKVQDKEW